MTILNRFFKYPLLPFILMGVCLWIFIIYKAIFVPLTCDEGNTIMLYAKMSVHDIVTYRDPIPNNHILNTLSIKALMGIFGMHQFVARLPNILGFAIYFAAATAFARKITENNWFAFGITVCLVINPYLIDFYSVARGYGLANAFLMLSIYHAVSWLQDPELSTKKLRNTVIFSLIAAYTNFGLLLCFCGMNIMLFLWAIIKRMPMRKIIEQVSWQTGFTILLAGMSYLPVKRMSETDQFKFWGVTGFYKDTIESLLGCLLFNSKYWGSNTYIIITYLGGFFLLVILGLAIWQLRQNKTLSPALFFVGLFLATVTCNLLQHKLLNTPYPTTRTALFYFPLFTAALIWLPTLLYGLRKQAGVALLSIFVLGASWNFGHNANLKYISEWWYDAHTYEVMKLIDDTHKAEKRTNTYILFSHPFFVPSFLFFYETTHPNCINIPHFYDHVETDSIADFFYCMDDNVPLLINKYDVVKHYDGGQTLLRRKDTIK